MAVKDFGGRIIYIRSLDLAYVKTVKTASTSLDVWFQQFVTPLLDSRERFNIASGRVIINDLGIVSARAPQKGLQTPWLSHMSASQVRFQVTDFMSREYKVQAKPTLVTSVRNPYAKLLSTFAYDLGASTGRSVRILERLGLGSALQWAGRGKSKRVIARQFEEWLSQYVRPECDDVTGLINVNNACDFFIRVESLQTDLERFTDEFHLKPKYALTVERSSQFPFSGWDQRDFYSQESQDLVLEMYGDWFTHFDYSRSLDVAVGTVAETE